MYILYIYSYLFSCVPMFERPIVVNFHVSQFNIQGIPKACVIHGKKRIYIWL